MRVIPVRQRVLRRQHRGHRADGRRRPRPCAGRASRPATATCCPTSASAKAASSTAPPSPTCPVPSKSSPPTASPCVGHSAPAAVLEPVCHEPCPPSSSSVAPTSARAPCSTASSASRSPSSRTAPASPATARRLEAEWLGDRSCWSTPAAGCPAAATSTRRSAARSRPRCKTADVVLFVVDAVGRPHRGRRVDRPLAAPHQGAGAAGRQQGRQRPPRERPLGVPGARPRRAACRSARCTAAAPATCSTRSSRCCPRATREPESATSRSTTRATQLWNAGDVAAAARRHRRPPQRRQEHAVQPAGRRGPLGRARHGRHHPRRHRHPGRHARRPDRVRRHRRHAPPQPHRRLGRVLLDGAGAAGHRRRRHRPAGHRRHRGRHQPGPAPGRAGRRRRLPDRGDAQQVGADRRRRAAPARSRPRCSASCTSSATRRS